MKNININIKPLAIGLCLLFSFSCDEFLEEDLRDQVARENFYNNDEEALAATTGVFYLLKNREMYGRIGIENYTGMPADEVGPTRNVNSQVYNYQIAEGVEDGILTWTGLYKVAQNSSSIIEGLDGNDAISEAVRNQTLGEALFLRALAYFNLTNLWGDVPYFRELLSVEELSNLERTPKETIRTDMKADLARAFNLLPNQTIGRASKWAAASLKAKYHLYDEEWAATIIECDKIINDSPHRLLDDYAAVFDQVDPNDQYNAEQIFVVDFKSRGTFGGNDTDRTDVYNPRLRDEPVNRNSGDPQRFSLLQDDLNAIGQDMTGFGWGSPLPEIADRANWEEGDLRYDATVVTEYLGYELSFPYYRKNWNLNQTSPRGNHHENRVVFRLADTYLMAAEAENELNGPAAAYAYVNKVRERAFEPDKPWSGLSKEEFREALQDERKFELAAEGERRMDLIRWGILLDVVKNTVHRPWNNPGDNIQPYHVLLPIPQDEIILNPNLLNTDPTNNGYR